MRESCLLQLRAIDSALRCWLKLSIGISTCLSLVSSRIVSLSPAPVLSMIPRFVRTCCSLSRSARPFFHLQIVVPGVNSPSGTVPDTASKPPVKDDQGRVRCKRFGCQKFFDPEGEPTECIHHKAPPIFHETAKWWSCCPDRKAYDWEGFMRIPGCETGFCSANPEGQIGQKRFLGGCDVRASSAPVRLDQDAPKEPEQSTCHVCLSD